MHLETKKTSLNFLVFLLSFLSFKTHLYEGTSVIGVGQTLSGNQTISSEEGTFELGFFTPGKSQNYYIGIWYTNLDDKTVVWVANRNHPISDPYNSELKLFPNGNLAILNESRTQIWSTNSTATTDNSSLAILLDNGNFVTRDYQDSSNVIWQSFDYPTDTWLPGGKIGYNKIKKEKIYLTAWKNLENPAPSLFSFEMETSGTSHILVYNRTRYWISGAWTGTSFVLSPVIESPYISNLKYISNVNESIFTYDIGYPKTLTRFMIDVTGLMQFVWLKNFPQRQWLTFWVRPLQCEVLDLCRDFSTCNDQLKAPCNCFQGYEPRVLKNWALGDYTDGCIRKSGRASKTSVWIVVGATGGFFILLGMVTLFILQLRIKKKVGSYNWEAGDLMLFKYKDIRKSTKYFSEKIGEGGFGSVFKGTLPNSRAIAVKRLKNLKQGEKQFRAEVSTLGQIQHINLVRLQGFCIEDEKRLLVFDYMKNGSLENYLFRENSNVLNWKARYKIMIGTAKGLNYLHENCRDCIIHCDIKPDNILLDDEFNAKVADFGLAKLLGREYSHVLTTIKGTRGYLAPEWMSNEAITAKVDVFSYGKMLFEIISGRRNSELLDDGDYFPALVAETLSEGEEVLTQFLDKRLEGEADSSELAIACKVACWCIQDDEKDRPSMGLVIQILEGLSEVGIPPIPRLLLGFTKQNKSQPIAYQNYTLSTISSIS